MFADYFCVAVWEGFIDGRLAFATAASACSVVRYEFEGLKPCLTRAAIKASSSMSTTSDSRIAIASERRVRAELAEYLGPFASIAASMMLPLGLRFSTI
ncbi:MAG: hypothetical protein QM775_04235 [Pirellulales bacterium]